MLHLLSEFRITYKQASDKAKNPLPYGTATINGKQYPLDRQEWDKLQTCVVLGDLQFFADWLLNRQIKPLTKKIPAKWDTQTLLSRLASSNEQDRFSNKVDRLSKIMGVH